MQQRQLRNTCVLTIFPVHNLVVMFYQIYKAYEIRKAIELYDKYRSFRQQRIHQGKRKLEKTKFVSFALGVTLSIMIISQDWTETYRKGNNKL